MKIRNLGRTGLKVTRLCLGTMTFGNQADKKTSFEILDKAFNAGINFIDTADAYPIGKGYEAAGVTESIIGEWIKGKRDDLVIASKCFMPTGPGPNDSGMSRKHIMNAIDKSLKRLGTDYLDLYQIHNFDPVSPIEEMMSTFDDLVDMGKIHYVGVSNWRAWQVAKANGIAERRNYSRVVSVQPRYNLLFRMIEEDLVPMSIDEGVGIITFNPLAGGILTGRYRAGSLPEQGTRFTLGNNSGALYQERYWQKATFEAVDRYISWCSEQNLDPVSTAVHWVIQQPGITSAIIGASRADQLESSLRADETPDLNGDQLKWLDALWFSLPRRREIR
ncbi:MAG: aldo/keto reductase [Thermoplasmataceae archaeon]